jgi:4-hydroxymandelate oxidase
VDEAIEDRGGARADGAGRVDLGRIVTLAEFESFARLAMEPAAFDYIAGGAWDELSLRDNDAAWHRYRLRPRVLVDVGGVDPSSTMVGTATSMPLAIAPMAVHGLAHPDGEIATARAAAAAGVPFMLSTTASRSIEEVASGAPDAHRWFQLYVQADAGRTRELVERAEAARYRAIVLTVDLPRLGFRERDRRSGFELPRLGNFEIAAPATHAGGIHVDGFEMLDRQLEVGLTWDDLAAIRSWSSLPFVLKGIMTAEDAVLAVEAGVDAIVVSNHGARQLDRTQAPIDVLDDVVAAVGGRTEVWVDGGVRRGLDIAIALGLGARAVLIGRPILWALATGGEAGVARALTILREEFEITLALLGARTPAAITRGHVERPSSLPSGT